ncbi:hypothetical protein NP493_1069g00080 [Ridgeia piscesae]|uniref:Uncharacterized protein n=1 Tax=Ridgeia piscesae TaxID=27915 RepID=A0AAD9NK18_RIDPI|nr:hypothetical protein NP493_1069g00080 [Ridgeia piscesae]
MQQPKATMKRTWNNKLCGCFDDCNVCLPATVIPVCYQCSVMDDFGEHCCVAWPCFLGSQMSLLALRYQFRNKNNIEVGCP